MHPKFSNSRNISKCRTKMFTQSPYKKHVHRIMKRKWHGSAQYFNEIRNPTKYEFKAIVNSKIPWNQFFSFCFAPYRDNMHESKGLILKFKRWNKTYQQGPAIWVPHNEREKFRWLHGFWEQEVIHCFLKVQIKQQEKSYLSMNER